MEHAFRAEPAVPGEQWARVARSEPTNPFLTSDYVRAHAPGSQPWLFTISAPDAEIVAAAVGYLGGGFMTRSLSFVSLPVLGDAERFWKGVLEFCRRERVTSLRVSTFGCRAAAIPDLGAEVFRRQRREFVLDLSSLPSPLPYGHANRRLRPRRQIKLLSGGLVRRVSQDHGIFCRRTAGQILVPAPHGRRFGRVVDGRPKNALDRSGSGFR